MKGKLSWAQTGCLTLVFLICLFVSLVCLHSWLQIKITTLTLPSGDQVIERLTPGPSGLLEPGSPTVQLYIQWHETSAKELFYDGPANFYVGDMNSSEDAEAHVYIVKTKNRLFWRPEAVPNSWKEWSFITPKRTPIYQYIESYASKHGPSDFREEAREIGRRLADSRHDLFIGDEQEKTWDLPYVISDHDFNSNTLTARLKSPVLGFPPELVFSGPVGQQGSWEFDPIKSDTANQ